MNQALQIRSALTAEQLPPPSQAWLQSLIHEQQPQWVGGGLVALVAAAKARLLATDLTTAGLLDAAAVAGISFPPELTAAGTAMQQEARLPRDVVVQVLDVENLSLSRWQQAQELEAIERGEQKRGREIIRVIEADEGPEDGGVAAAGGPAGGGRGPAAGTGGAAASTAATHRLVLQDGRGQSLYALELSRIHRIAVGRLAMGEKLVLRSGTAVARGVVLLEPTAVRFLGGHVDALHTAWLEGRRARLQEGARRVQ